MPEFSSKLFPKKATTSSARFKPPVNLLFHLSTRAGEMSELLLEILEPASTNNCLRCINLIKPRYTMNGIILLCRFCSNCIKSSSFFTSSLCWVLQNCRVYFLGSEHRNGVQNKGNNAFVLNDAEVSQKLCKNDSKIFLFLNQVVALGAHDRFRVCKLQSTKQIYRNGMSHFRFRYWEI